MDAKPKIAFVALNSYNILAQRHDIRHVGGAETQQVLAAKWLCERGFYIDFVTLDHGQPDRIVHGEMTSYKAYTVDSGLPVLRFVYPRTTGLWAAMSRTSADVFYQRGAGTETGLVALWCRMHGRPFIFSVASDTDCLPDLPALGKWHERLLYGWGLRNATAIVAQTERQQQLLQSSFGLQSTIVRSSRPEPNEPIPSRRFAFNSGRPRVLWVGRLTWEKRFDWLLDVAEACPEMDFDVACHLEANRDDQRQRLRRAQEAENIQLYGYLPPHRLNDLYRQATLLCNTSSYEGFPNTFLEAWSHGIPVATTFDPDGIIEKNHTGWTATTVQELTAALKKAVFSTTELTQAGMNARTYYLANHIPDRCLPDLSRIITETVRSSPGCLRDRAQC